MANPINIIGGFYKDDTLSWACQDTVNYLPTQAEVSGTKTPSMLRTPPGLRPWVKIGDGPNFSIRGMHDAEGRLFVVAGNKLYQISNKGVAIPLGTIPGRGRVSIAHNQIAGGNEILVVNGNSGYVWNTLRQNFTRITDPGYPGAFQAVFADGYLIQAEPFGRYAFHSDLANALEYNTLDRFEAESEPDKIVAVVVSNDEVRVFGERTTQLFANTGAAQGTFQSKGITINRGCAGRWTALAMDNGVFFLGDDGVVYRDNGYSPIRISTYAIEQAIADNDWSQAFAFAWEDRGHSVYYLTFPDGQTWGYDVSSQAWHRRASYHPTYEVSRRWRLNNLVYSNGQWIGGDSTSGKLFVLDWDYMLEDVGTELVSERSTQIAYAEGSRFTVDMVELIARTGDQATIAGSVVFPDQPEGPTITGDAPDGVIGQPYSYQYQITPGDSPITSVRVIGTELPDGWSISNSGLLTGPGDVSIEFSFVVRAIDANGLYAEVSDSIKIGAAWWLLRTDGGLGSSLWISADPLEWSDAVSITPFTARSNRGSRQIGPDRVLVTSSVDTRINLPKSPDGGIIESQESTAPAFTHLRVFEGLILGFFDNSLAVNYGYSTDGGDTWSSVSVGGGRRIWDIARLDSGRWIAYRELEDAYGMVYSDEPIPLTWIASASGIPPGIAPYTLCTDGKTALMLVTLDRVIRSTDGATWQTRVPLAPALPTPIATVSADGRFFFAGNPQSGSGTLCYTDAQGLSFETVSIESLNGVGSLLFEGGRLVASGTALLSGSTSLISVSSDLGETWGLSDMPFDVTSASSCVCFPVK